MLDGALFPILYAATLVIVIALFLRARLGADAGGAEHPDTKRILVQGLAFTAAMTVLMILVGIVIVLGLVLFILDIGAEVWGGSS